MNNIIFVDLNKKLVEKVAKLGIESYFDDYFRKSTKIPRAVLMTASNPRFSMGGGIDALFAENFPYYCRMKKRGHGGNERIGNVVFAITVNNNYQATKELVKSAIEYAISQTGKDETLVLMGCGTGIGGLSDDDFIEVLKEILISE